MIWYVVTFFGGFIIGFMLAAICASAGQADREIERMLNEKQKGRD